MGALEAGRLAPADDLLPALSAVLGTDAAALGGYLDTVAVLAAFGRRLRELRTKSNLTQDALGRRAGGLNRVSIYSLESGSADPRLTTIRRLARGLGSAAASIDRRGRAECQARRLIRRPRPGHGLPI